MADLDGLKVAKDYHVDTPFANCEGFYVKGANSLDWGMKKHLSNIFDPKSGNTVMFAFDHGYFMGSTAGLERLDLLLPQLAPYVDCFMGTRGAIRSCVPPEITKSVALRCSSGSSMLQSDLSHEVISVDIEEAIRMNADCMAAQVFIGGDGQQRQYGEENAQKNPFHGPQYTKNRRHRRHGSVPWPGICACTPPDSRRNR